MEKLNILTDKYFSDYKKSIWDFKQKFDNFLLNSKALDFWYLLESSSVFSSRIEGNSLDLNSFMNLKMQKGKSSKDLQEIENLIKAYDFAKKNKLTQKNFLQIHKILSKTLLIKSKRWVYRQEKVWVFWREWLIYMAIEEEFVEKEMQKLFDDIQILLKNKLSLEEIFYYASQIHLRFVHIHPFLDWNWRTARLLEKWFLTEKLWEKLWKIRSEEYYFNNKKNYYQNINLWVNYYELNYDNSINFLTMLVKSLEL